MKSRRGAAVGSEPDSGAESDTADTEKCGVQWAMRFTESNRRRALAVRGMPVAPSSVYREPMRLPTVLVTAGSTVSLLGGCRFIAESMAAFRADIDAITAK